MFLWALPRLDPSNRDPLWGGASQTMERAIGSRTTQSTLIRPGLVLLKKKLKLGCKILVTESVHPFNGLRFIVLLTHLPSGKNSSDLMVKIDGHFRSSEVLNQSRPFSVTVILFKAWVSPFQAFQIHRSLPVDTALDSGVGVFHFDLWQMF